MKKLEITFFSLIIILVNIPLFLGISIEPMTYSLDAVMNGQIWRIFTHPFAHISIYHMLIDASAFLMLYHQLKQNSPVKRLSYIIICGIFSLIAINIQLAQLNINTYCGLSGIAHGLMAIIGLEMIYGEKETRKAGVIMTAVIISKCLLETLTGTLLLQSYHLGNVGVPITMSHTGGLAGGISAFYMLNINQIKNILNPTSPKLIPGAKKYPPA